MRTLVYLLLIYLVYRAIKSWLAKNISAPGPRHAPGGSIDDVMVKDPYCNVYIPKREGIELFHQGKHHYFCSSACRDKFLALDDRNEDHVK